MKKNDYQKPEIRVVKIQHKQHLLSGSVNSVDGGDTGIGFGGGGTGPAKARSFGGWDDEE
ncbi:MAG: hypothetical protein IJ533_00750 [Prevotella sp.]|nr:hypothetical protein [Prevotella sp.]MBQ8486165.1 hypothetical protein [Prevotella sp.]MBQ8938264.1 hypothetical protein [Bacteroidaceae bacterium]